MRLSSRSVATLMALLSYESAGCYHWVPIAPEQLHRDAAEVQMRSVRFTAAGGAVENVLEVHRVDYPTVQGWSEARGQELRINASEYSSMAVRRLHGGATAGLVIGLIVGTSLAVLGGFAIAFSGVR